MKTSSQQVSVQPAQIITTDAQQPVGTTTKLFADKENNCTGMAASHQNNGKLAKSGGAIATLKHMNTSDNVMMRPSSKLDQPAEHQMEDE